ncbi:MAG: threonylcarbamoyl-AMP synthase [Oscillatoriales cyanobacterium SM2_1_8]|nr:threonylcarbamoyl-AMP synthase [Oscillatoriales cyanobacterium SM2_1_8]
MAEYLSIHPETPQPRMLERLIDALRSGAVVLYPTDTVPAIGCDLHNKRAVQRVRQIEAIAPDKPLTFLCSSLANLAAYAVVTDPVYRIVRSLVPGPYTFVLPATKLVPKLVLEPKRRTTGVRVPAVPILQETIRGLGNPVVSTSAKLLPQATSWAELRDRYEKLVDVVVEDGLEASGQVSTILDMTGDRPVVLRWGAGPLGHLAETWIDAEPTALVDALA